MKLLSEISDGQIIIEIAKLEERRNRLDNRLKHMRTDSKQFMELKFRSISTWDRISVREQELKSRNRIKKC